jgi:hypothetical protein
VSFGADYLARVDRRNAVPESNHLTDELMAHDKGRADSFLGPLVPAFDV